RCARAPPGSRVTPVHSTPQRPDNALPPMALCPIQDAELASFILRFRNFYAASTIVSSHSMTVPRDRIRIGIDLGGTKIEAAALGLDGSLRYRRRVATPAGDYPGTIEAIRDLVASLERELGERGTVGIGIPGALSPTTGLVKNANSTCLIGRPLDRDLTAALGRPVRLANDADCFALSEAVDGAAAGAATVFGAILGTGVGGGVVVRGRLLSGPNAIAGEWGHSP